MLLKKNIKKRAKDITKVREQTNQGIDYHGRIHQVECDIEKGVDFFDQGEQKNFDKNKLKRMDTLKQ